jgi:hypothetical protein
VADELNSEFADFPSQWGLEITRDANGIPLSQARPPREIPQEPWPEPPSFEELLATLTAPSVLSPEWHQQHAAMHAARVVAQEALDSKREEVVARADLERHRSGVASTNVAPKDESAANPAADLELEVDFDGMEVLNPESGSIVPASRTQCLAVPQPLSTARGSPEVPVSAASPPVHEPRRNLATGPVPVVVAARPKAVRGPTSGPIPVVPPALGPAPFMGPATGPLPTVPPTLGPPRRASTSGPVPVLAGPTRYPSGELSLPITGEQKGVVHMLAGAVKRGTLRDVDLTASTLALETGPGEVQAIPTDQVKAVFFLPNGPVAGGPPVAGRHVRIALVDGRTLVGVSTDQLDQVPGLFIVPSGTAGTAERIFVFQAGIRSVTEVP